MWSAELGGKKLQIKHDYSQNIHPFQTPLSGKHPSSSKLNDNYNKYCLNLIKVTTREVTKWELLYKSNQKCWVGCYAVLLKMFLPPFPEKLSACGERGEGEPDMVQSIN